MGSFQLSGYSLLDSGAGKKLECLGVRTVVRPSSLAVWDRRKSCEVWSAADAEFIPSKGWRFVKEKFETWPFNCGHFDLELRLQNNGQIGLFPEHASYFGELSDQLARLQQILPGPVRLLNLFAYTGMP